MSRPQLPVFVNKNLDLEYFGQVWLVDKAEVRNSKVLVCKFIFKKKKKKKIFRKISQM